MDAVATHVQANRGHFGQWLPGGVIGMRTQTEGAVEERRNGKCRQGRASGGGFGGAVAVVPAGMKKRKRARGRGRDRKFWATIQGSTTSVDPRTEAPGVDGEGRNEVTEARKRNGIKEEWVYMLGGGGDKGAIWRAFDPVGTKWRTLPDQDRVLTSAEYYDEIKNQWVLIENMWPASHTPLVSPTPPLLVVVDNELYAVDATTMEFKSYQKDTNTWKTLGRVPNRSVDSSGWGMGFKAVGKDIFLIGGSSNRHFCNKIHACNLESSGGEPKWRRVCRLFFTSGFIYSCTVMTV
ncbi:unnamed protein product [Sphagnum compactum]